MYVWVKEPMEQVKPNILGMGRIKSNKGVNWAIVSLTKRLARWNTTDSEPGKSSNFICAIDSFSPCKKRVRRASNCDVMRT